MRTPPFSFKLTAAAIFAVAAFAAQAEDKLIESGRQVFLNNCVACHGPQADGKGPAAAAIVGAKPRNLIKDRFKYGSSEKEVLSTITDGVKDTAMPSWASLPESDRKALVQFIFAIRKNPGLIKNAK